MIWLTLLVIFVTFVIWIIAAELASKVDVIWVIIWFVINYIVIYYILNIYIHAMRW